MSGYAIWATMQAKAGREAEARAFLEEAQRRIARDEPGTTSFHAVDFGDGRFAVFNTFVDEAAIAEHANGPIAAWVLEMNPKLFIEPYAVHRARLVAMKPFTPAPARERTA